MPLTSRRQFFRSGLTSAASLAGLSQIGAFASGGSDYKALVCVYLAGGNDGNDTLIPIATQAQNYSAYSAVRKTLALPQGNLHTVSARNGDLYGLHPKLGAVQALYNQNKVALLANVGVLAVPVTRQQYLNKQAPVPAQLFSHSDQADQWHTSQPNNFGTAGWAGRTADVLQAMNAPSTFPMVVAMASCGLFCTGQQTRSTSNYANPSLLLSAVGAAGSARRNAFQQLLNFDNGLSLVQAANRTGAAGVADAALFSDALASTPAPQTPFPSTHIGQQLAQVARIIRARAAFGMNRQIFFCQMDGYDTHGGQLTAQDTLLSQLAAALQAFYTATQELGVENQVTTFTSSEFGRTLQYNTASGTDHGWGGHQMILGGAVKGGDLYGNFPTLALAGPDDSGNRGAWIPTTSVDQYGATLASWFGVSDADLPKVFPNLGNFAVKKLGFLG